MFNRKMKEMDYILKASQVLDVIDRYKREGRNNDAQLIGNMAWHADEHLAWHFYDQNQKEKKKEE